MATKRPTNVYRTWAWILSQRDGGYNCHYCGANLIPPPTGKDYVQGAPDAVPGSVDHLIPLSRGGYHAKHNLVLACVRCNQDKRDKTAAEYLASRMVTP
jgi:5-methylcytosine-specific restriction protein A